MSAAGTRSKRKAKGASDSNTTAASTTTTTAPSRSGASILTPGPLTAPTASIPSSLHQSAFSIPVRASSPQSSQSPSQPLGILPPLPLSVFSTAANPTSSSSSPASAADPKEQTDDESDSPDSNAVDDTQRAKKAKTEPSSGDGASSSSAPSPSPTSHKKQPEPELSDAAKHVLFERRWSPQYSSDWSSSSALSLHLSWQKLIDQLQQQFGVRWTKKKLADAADHAKKVYVDRRKVARLPGHRTPQPWKWHQLMESWLGATMSDSVKEEDSTTASTSSSSSAAQAGQPAAPAAASEPSKAGGRGPAPPLPGSSSAASAAGGAPSPAMDGALNHALYALVQDSQRRHEELARAHSDKLDRLLAMMQTVVDRLPAEKSE